MSLKNTEPRTIEASIRTGIEAAMLDLKTVHPGSVVAVNADGSVNVKLMIHKVFRDDKTKAFPVISKLPVLYSGNDQYSVTFPVGAGDEGLVLFAERDISLFLENGKEGRPNALRMHHLSDGLFLPMPISKPKKLTVSADTLLLANGITSIEITSGLIKMNGNVEINGNSVMSGNVEATGSIEADGEVTAKAAVPALSVSLSTHTTAGVTTGGGISGTPTPGS